MAAEPRCYHGRGECDTAPPTPCFLCENYACDFHGERDREGDWLCDECVCALSGERDDGR